MSTKARGSCWCRCSCWRPARSSPAISPRIDFVGDGRAEFWKQRDPGAAGARFDRRGRAQLPALIDFLPLIAGVLGIATRLSLLYRCDPAIPAAAGDAIPRALPVPAQQMVFRRALRPALRAAAPLRSATGCGRPATARSSTGSAPTASPRATRELAREASRLQTGYVYHYAFAMLIGVVALVTWYLFPR